MTIEEHVVSQFAFDHAGNSGPCGESHGQELTGVTVVVCTYKRARSLSRFLDSLAAQDRMPNRLIIVDASPDGDSESMLKSRDDLRLLGSTICYFRVDGPLRGLTRQRNFSLRWVETDLAAFFDDDIVLNAGCLKAMENVHRTRTDGVAGVAAYMDGSGNPPNALWRVRRFLRMVGDLRPGSYQRSGMSVPWAFLPATGEDAEGDYLPGGATMWRTSLLRELGFDETFPGYGQGEDLEFSLRARRKGKLVVAGAARLQHLHEGSGRPDDFKLGYMAIFNRYQIHRSGLDDRGARDIVRFVYTWSLDTIMLARHVVVPGRIVPVLKQCAGRMKAAIDLMAGRGAARSESRHGLP